MHEISVLQKAVDLAEQTAIENNISRISYLTLEVGELSGYVPLFFLREEINRVVLSFTVSWQWVFLSSVISYGADCPC